ncbi:MAG: mannose transporter subunit [Clostridiales bacterium]|jgi:mannose/fructose-specific phosphotransferase system component IIA|nr:mannose transporter subunit [Clostridiales bacterium]
MFQPHLYKVGIKSVYVQDINVRRIDMKGILVISHGDMAKGMVHSASLFFGSDIEQLQYVCLQAEDNPDEFRESVEKAVAEIDTGEGVVILADLFGGTPCNQAIKVLNEKIDLISGANFMLLLDILGKRLYGDVEPGSLIEAGRQGIINVKEYLLKVDNSDFDE